MEGKIDPKKILQYHAVLLSVRKEIGKIIVGQDSAITALIVGLLANGHMLVEGIPGIAKTLLLRALARTTGCEFSRIQFTVDLLPTDITGITAYSPQKGFFVVKGPIFANFLLADEINRAPAKCVLGDTPIIMENGDIGDIKSIIKKYNGKKTYHQNNEYWIVPHTKLRLLAFDPSDGKIKPEEVKYLYKQKTLEPYCNIRLKSGRKIKTSKIHPFFTLVDGKVSTVDAIGLNKGDCVLIPRRLSVSGTNELKYSGSFLETSKRLYKEISRRKRLYIKVQRYKKLYDKNFKIKLSNNKDYQLIKTFINIKPRYLSYSNKYFFSTPEQFGQIYGIKMPKSVNKELAQFMAILISEGSINKNSIYLSMKEREIPELFIKLIKSLFGLKTRLLYDKKRQQYRVALESYVLVDLLKAIGYNPHLKSGDKSIPRFILTSDDKIVKEFLRLYYDCDGGVSRDCIKVTTKSKNIANSLSYLLLRMGFVARIDRKLSKTNIGNYSYKKRFYNLRLYGGEFYNFHKKINFFTQKNRKKLQNLIKNNKGQFTDLVPGLHNVIRDLRKNNKITHKHFFNLTGMHAHNLENPKNSFMHSRYRLKKLMPILGGKDNSYITKIITGDFYCDFVKEKKVIIPKKEYWLYDFSMKNTHSFIAGFGGIISHNTQGALLEAMQEKQTTIGKETFPMMDPFFVMATQNPIETSGTYPLPEAQIDRFLFKLFMGYPNMQDEKKILRQNITLQNFEDYGIRPIINPKILIEMQNTVKDVYLSPEIEDYIIRLIDCTRRPKEYGIELGKYIEWGASPRGSIGLFIAGKANALVQGKSFVTPQHIKEVAYPILRHRILLNYEGQADEIKTDKIISEILAKVPLP